MPVEPRRLRAVCRFCRCSRYTDVLPVDTDDNEAADAARFAQLTPCLAEWGWSVDRDPEDGLRCCVCPDCAARRGKGLPAYNGRGRCPKCGHNRVACVYSDGRNNGALVPVEHLVRGCLRCGFSWPEATKDAGDVPSATERTAEVTADVVRD